MGMMNDFDDLEFEEMDSEETIATSRGSNRTFLVVAGILGGILLIALLAIAGYAVVILPGRDTGQQTQEAAINATNTVSQLSSLPGNIADLNTADFSILFLNEKNSGYLRKDKS